MSKPRYLIVKYVSDLRRVEPRNIGVILWTPSGVGARFLAEKPGHPGEIDGRSIPSFVTSSSAYKQWVDFWCGELAKAEIKSVGDSRKKANRGDPAFLDLLMDSSKGNFVLADGGLLLDPVEDIDDAVNFLFSILVETGTQEEPRDATLEEVCDRLIEETNLPQDPYFHSSFEVPCSWAPGIEERFEFSHAYRNGTIKRLYQRVPLPRRKTAQRKNVHDVAWMFERVTERKIVDRENAVSLVYVPQEQATDSDLLRSVKVLETVSRVINVGDEQAARSEFQELPALAR